MSLSKMAANKEKIPEDQELSEAVYLQCCIGCGRDRGPMPPAAAEVAKVGTSYIEKNNHIRYRSYHRAYIVVDESPNE